VSVPHQIVIQHPSRAFDARAASRTRCCLISASICGQTVYPQLDTDYADGVAQTLLSVLWQDSAADIDEQG